MPNFWLYQNQTYGVHMYIVIQKSDVIALISPRKRDICNHNKRLHQRIYQQRRQGRKQK